MRLGYAVYQNGSTEAKTNASFDMVHVEVFLFMMEKAIGINAFGFCA